MGVGIGPLGQKAYPESQTAGVGQYGPRHARPSHGHVPVDLHDRHGQSQKVVAAVAARPQDHLAGFQELEGLFQMAGAQLRRVGPDLNHPPVPPLEEEAHRMGAPLGEVGTLLGYQVEAHRKSPCEPRPGPGGVKKIQGSTSRTRAATARVSCKKALERAAACAGLQGGVIRVLERPGNGALAKMARA